jgi:hypothetical protein
MRIPAPACRRGTSRNDSVSWTFFQGLVKNPQISIETPGHEEAFIVSLVQTNRIG